MIKGIYIAGIYLYSIALIGFGSTQLAFGRLMNRFFPGITASSSLAYATGIIFIIAGIGLLFHQWRKHASVVAVLVFLLLLLYPHLPRLVNDLYDANRWTIFFQLVACCAGALLVAGRTLASRMSWMGATGRYAFAISLLIFGIQHFMYAHFIQTLIPGWLPSPSFWALLVRIALIAAAISIALGILIRLPGLFTGIMFLSWIPLFHIPKVTADTNSETEWTNLFIAFAMSGTGFLLASLSRSGIIINPINKKKVSK
jgi:uncharacterized membrane protein YphA (DoxX/SURF4 family)